MACIHTLSWQGVLRWLAALTQGEHARFAVMAMELPTEPYKAGVSGPKRTTVLNGVTAEKCPGPESLVTITSDKV